MLVVRSGCSGRSGSQEMSALVMPFFLGPQLSPFFWPVMLWPQSAQGLLSTWGAHTLGPAAPSYLLKGLPVVTGSAET